MFVKLGEVHFDPFDYGGCVDSSEHLFLVIKHSAIDLIQEQDVKVNIQVQRRAETLDEGHRAGARRFAVKGIPTPNILKNRRIRVGVPLFRSWPDCAVGQGKRVLCW